MASERKAILRMALLIVLNSMPCNTKIMHQETTSMIIFLTAYFSDWYYSIL